MIYGLGLVTDVKMTNKTPIPENTRVKITFKDEVGEFFGVMDEDIKFHLDDGIFSGYGMNGHWYSRVDEWEYAPNVKLTGRGPES